MLTQIFVFLVAPSLHRFNIPHGTSYPCSFRHQQLELSKIQKCDYCRAPQSSSLLPASHQCVLRQAKVGRRETRHKTVFGSYRTAIKNKSASRNNARLISQTIYSVPAHLLLLFIIHLQCQPSCA